VAPRTLRIHLDDGGTRVLTCEQVFLNVGTHPAIPDIPGLDGAGPLTNIEALELDYAPAHLIVLGGGLAHPTMAEGLGSLLSNVAPRSVGAPLAHAAIWGGNSKVRSGPGRRRVQLTSPTSSVGYPSNRSIQNLAKESCNVQAT
jgi:hypothetical protein